ncbi:methylated-DNA--[protein]-cysteine S-methyltransferase [Parapedobacter lycopersici]|uniref:methylated-DNA--[protein]-cysteine S-methyltransferase n=1 Tax=Parapedobacter lycopersici TaxID=1864939 RepID=UPI00214DAC8E|nr:methylated-DNA--[protein]-cysteine S-methyltransferase [Parapedobacter lycopersici]
METQQQLNYERIARAIDYIRQHFKEQPNLDAVAEEVNLSPFHFQRLFTDWAGVSPKKFLQYTSLTHAKGILRGNREATLFDTAYETGLSGTSRLHDLFVQIEGMTPAAYKNGGKQLEIAYDFGGSPFGRLIVASTSKGVCHLAFFTDERQALADLQAKFPNANMSRKSVDIQQDALSVFQSDWEKLPEVKLHLKGTAFQLKVWEALLKIPMGQLTTYGSIAQQIEMPSASRAVGTAIGSNPVAFLIPCHRVIQSTGTFGGYMWGETRKTAMIGWEGAKIGADPAQLHYAQ